MHAVHITYAEFSICHTQLYIGQLTRNTYVACYMCLSMIFCTLERTMLASYQAYHSGEQATCWHALGGYSLCGYSATIWSRVCPSNFFVLADTKNRANCVFQTIGNWAIRISRIGMVMHDQVMSRTQAQDEGSVTTLPSLGVKLGHRSGGNVIATIKIVTAIIHCSYVGEKGSL